MQNTINAILFFRNKNKTISHFVFDKKHIINVLGSYFVLRISYLFLMCVCLACPLLAQETMLKGKVTDAGKPIIQAKVYFKSYEEASTLTDATGAFTLTIPTKLKGQSTLKGIAVMPSGVRHTWNVQNEAGKFVNIDIKDSRDKARKRAEEAEKEAQKLVSKKDPADSLSQKATVVEKDENALNQANNTKQGTLQPLKSKEINTTFQEIHDKYKTIFAADAKDLPIQDDIQNIVSKLQQEQELTLQRNETIREEIKRITQKLQNSPQLSESEKDNIRKQILALEAQLKANIAAYEKLRQATERELEMLKRLANIQENFLQRNQFFLWSLGIVSVFLLTVAGFYYFISKQRLKQNKRLEELVQKTKQQQEELLAINDKLEEKTKEIGDSVNSAHRIQDAMLPTNAELTEVFGQNNYFVLYKPHQGKVSGDFYFMEEKRMLEKTDGYEKYHNCLFFVCADCTGHGIPGALMTMLCNELLHDVIQNQKTTQDAPARILRRLHAEVRRTLHYKTSGIADGMDLVLLMLYKAEKQTEGVLSVHKIDFAGAKNNIYCLENTAEATLQEIKGDRKGVSGPSEGEEYEDTIREFHTQTLPLPATKELTIYMCSDGYQDQFGSVHNKKFGPKKLRAIFQANHQKPFKVQNEILSNEIVTWMEQGKESQTDDITVLGLRVKCV